MSNTPGNSYSKVDYVFKVVLSGDSAVGKSQLLARFAKNEFNVESKATIAIEFETKTLLIDQKKVAAQIWDTAGQERYRAVISAYYRGAVGAMLVYDLTNRQSFDHMTRWLEELRNYADKNIVIMLIGNKCDLANSRAVPTEVAQEFSKRENLYFMEISARDATHVEKAFMDTLTEIYKIHGKKNLNEKTTSLKGTTRLVPDQDESATSIAERAQISERMRKLQELVPHMDKQTSTLDMLDLAVDYIKDLQEQYKALKDCQANCICSAKLGRN